MTTTWSTVHDSDTARYGEHVKIRGERGTYKLICITTHRLNGTVVAELFGGPHLQYRFVPAESIRTAKAPKAPKARVPRSTKKTKGAR